MKKLLLILILLLVNYPSYAKMTITDFSEEITFTNYGTEISTKIRVRVDLENNNQYYKNWTYVFDKNTKMELINASVKSKQHKINFANNQLSFLFDNARRGDILEFNFKYKTFEENNLGYIRNEYIYIPEFAKNANGRIVVNIPQNLAKYSLNRKFAQNGNIYIWSGKVPEEGFLDMFSLTLKNAQWDISIFNEIKASENINNLNVSIPLYLKNGNNVVKSYDIKTNFNQNYSQIIEEKDLIAIAFKNVKNSVFQMLLKSTIENGSDNKIWIKLNPQDYLSLDENKKTWLTPLSNRILVNSKENEISHIILAKWVNEAIEYDLSYVGKDLSTQKILEQKRGVCIHYAQLYNDLLRSAGIPSVIVSGVSYNTEKKEFEDHAWNIVYTNGQWQSIDPTWGIYSGILPVSHIFLYFENIPVMNYYTYSKGKINFQTDIKKDIKFIKKAN